MKNKKKFMLGMALLISIFLIITISADVSYCCEKLKNNGPWCQNAPEEECDSNLKKAPTSCESTSYCRLGCCYNSQEGTCMENTPESVCDQSQGVWENDAQCDVPQCSLGCCLIGNQAAFVTQTRCKRLSSLYGLEINFRTDMSNEIQCIISATSDAKGACVFEKEFEKTCLFTTKKECQETESSSGNSNTKFHERYLCSAEILGTNCGPTEQTKCVEGRDEVFFIDSCGNLANIYDASKIKNKDYWSKIYGKINACGSGSNADSSECGNCDYYLGSTCKTYKRGKDRVKPLYGDYICRDLSCEYEGEKYNHGETWCAAAKGVSKIMLDSKGEITSTQKDLPGGRYFRLVCYNGDVTVEPCAAFRQEVCIQSDVNGFKTSACRVNMWQDCYSQSSKKDCENSDKRDCKWTKGPTGSGLTSGVCVPKYAPGFDFWETTGDATSLCSLATKTCTVEYVEEYDKTFDKEKECKTNCVCLENSWKNDMNNICVLLGDCGSSINYINIKGYESKTSISKSAEYEGE